MKRKEYLRQIILSRYSTKKEKEDALDALLALVAARANKYWSFREGEIVDNLDDTSKENEEKDNLQNSEDICHGKEAGDKTLPFHDWLNLLNEEIFDCEGCKIVLSENQTQQFKMNFRTRPITFNSFYSRVFGRKKWSHKFRI